MSDCLSRILRSFKLEFEQIAPTGKPGKYEKGLYEETGDIPFGGEETPESHPFIVIKGIF
jgi:hypothetical protein